MRLAGHDDKIVLACLLHDISVIGFICADHGYWAAQLVAPYVDEEVRWAIEKHQVLRFFPDESVGYRYPPEYLSYFGPDFAPSAFVRDEYERAPHHRHYMSARLVTLHDVYTFDQAPPADLGLDEFEDIVGRHFRQPKEGLGFDGSASAHMWRTIMQPTRFL